MEPGVLSLIYSNWNVRFSLSQGRKVQSQK